MEGAQKTETGLLKQIKSMLSRRPDGRAGFSADQLAPTRPFFAVGDLHGCTEPFKQLHKRLEAQATGEEAMVFLGDYIDRGPDSRQMLAWLFELSQERPGDVTCLMGNHERMMIDFIDDPAGRGAIWLRNGGLETLASFGVLLRKQASEADVAVEIANALEEKLPAGLLDWLRGLPLRWQSGNLHCTHAAFSPRRDPEDQREEVMLWGHPDFLRAPRDDGQIVVHGHTIVPEPVATGSRISVDTGVYRTGRLSAVRIAPGALTFTSSSD